MQINRRFLTAGCDTEGRVRLYLGGKNGDNLVALSNETWSEVTAQFGYTVGELVNVSIEVNYKPETRLSDPNEGPYE